MSIWEKVDEKELKNVKGAGSPCNSHGQDIIVGLTGIFSGDASGAGGSCQPAYEWSHPKPHTKKQVGHGCTARTVYK